MLRSSGFLNRISVRFLALSIFSAVLAFAQSTGAVQGTVTDSSGAAVPNAAITVRDVNTSQERKLSTDTGGSYLVSSLPVGTYRIEVKAAGMAQTVADNLAVSVGTTVRQDFSLKVATASEVVEVAGASAL